MRFAGYAAIFNRPDRGGDVIRKGAFAASLARHGAAGAIPLLWQHRAGHVIGRVESLAEDERGLRVIAELGSGEEAKQAAGLIARGKLDGLSFGYRVRAGEQRDGGFRELTELELVEVSLVAEPMQPKARVHAVED